jgi:hypothetical protein
MSPRHIWAVAKADFLERMRRPPVYMAMAVGAFLCYLCVIDQAGVTLEGARGVWNSAWCAGSLAVMATSYTTLICFYVIRSAVQRDEQTGAGRLIAASPISGFSYLLGKAVSNFGVLLSIALVFLLASPVLQWSHHEGYAFRPWHFLNPFLCIVIPSSAFVAALAVLFECHPWLKRGLGNVIYLFAWVEMLRESAMYGRGWTDMVGFYGFMQSSETAELAQGLKPRGKGLNIGHAEYDHWNIFQWDGFHFSWHQTFLRLEWFVIAAAVVLIAAYFFKRFDPDVRPAISFPLPKFLRRRKVEQTTGKWESELLKLSSLESRIHGRFYGVVRAELRLLLTSFPKFLYVVVAFANLLALMPAEKEGPAGPGVLAFLWIVPVLVWSDMGAREQAPHARPLVFSAPHSFLRQLPAEWLAGVLIALACSFGVGINLLVHHDYVRLAVWLSGAMFIASLSIACGTWSRSTRLFQGLYTGWWYLAMNNAPNMDFTGVTGQRHAVGYCVLALGLFSAAMAHRWWNTERAGAMQLVGVFRSQPREKKAAII